ncbi:MAG: glycosyltransferase family 2 protein [Bacteroidales bacterium]|nr:glycosyltransferase family 2 protein [Bacteroidales bacterium]
MSNIIEYSIVIPVFNSSKSLIEIVERIKNVFINEIKQTYEIIFVDDGSSNIITWPTLKKLTAENNAITIVKLMRNFGKSSAVLCGFSYVKGNYVIMMDDDLQHFPEDIPKLIIQKKHDIVIAEFKEKKHSFFKQKSSNIKGWFDYKLIGKPKHIKNSAFILINSKIIRAINNLNISNPFISALLFFVSKDIVNVECTHGNRIEGKTGYTFKKLIIQFSNLLINNSSYLLKSVAYIGVTFSIFSFFMIIYYLYRYFFHGIDVTGWLTLVILTLLIGGLILFSIGVIGEYLIRIIKGIEKKPAFIVREEFINYKNYNE